MAIVKSKLLKQLSQNYPNFLKKDLEKFSNIILDVKNDNLIESTKSEVKDLCAAFPVYESSKINP